MPVLFFSFLLFFYLFLLNLPRAQRIQFGQQLRDALIPAAKQRWIVTRATRMSLENTLGKQIIELVQAKLLQYGFCYDSEILSFVAQQGEFVHQYSIPLIEKYGQLSVDILIGIRFHPIEEIFHRTSEFTGAQRDTTSTIGVSIRKWTNGPYYQAHLERASEVKQAVDTIIANFHENAVHYFEKYSSFKVIEAVFNESPQERCIHMVNGRFRCSKGLIAAKLVGRPNYDEILAIYDERMKPNNPLIYPKYWRPLVEDLESLELSPWMARCHGSG